MQDARRFLETALGELRETQNRDGQDGRGGRRAARVADLLRVALRTPGADTLRQTMREIECCYRSQGRDVDLPSLQSLDRELSRTR